MPTPFEKKEFQQALDWAKRARAGELEPVPCVSGWMDVCGYGSQLEKCSWDLKVLQKSGTINLLSEVYRCVGHPFWIGVKPAPYENVLIINDGVARTVDLATPKYINIIQAVFYVRDLILGHLTLLRVTSSHGLGIRTVLAGGERIQYSPTYFTGNSILSHGETTSEFGKKLLEQNFLYNPAEFQMNTAFAKAYTIDAKGSKSGFSVNKLYIEEAFFQRLEIVSGLEIKKNEKSLLFKSNGNPAIELYFDEIIPFKEKGLQTNVLRINKMRVDEKFESEETVIDLDNWELEEESDEVLS